MKSEEYNSIKDFPINPELPEHVKIEMTVFQNAMASLEEEYLQVLNNAHPSQIEIHKLNQIDLDEKLRIAENEKDLRLNTIDGIYEEELANIKKKYDHSKKSLFERTLTSIAKCDSHIVSDMKSIFPERRKKIDSTLLDVSRYPNDDQIMQKVLHSTVKALNISVSDKDHDLDVIKNEMEASNLAQADNDKSTLNSETGKKEDDGNNDE